MKYRTSPSRLTRDVVDTWFAAEEMVPHVDHPAAALSVLLPLLTDDGEPLGHEQLAVIALDRRQRVLDVTVLTRGSDRFTIVDPKQIFRWALTRPGRRAVCSIILGHNHPSGDPAPSIEDRNVTRRIADAGKILGIKLTDHIIVGANGKYISLAEQGELT